MRRVWILLSLSLLFAQGNSLEATADAGEVEKALAKEILDNTDVKGGLVVHIGCGDGELTAALRAGDGYVVLGLDTNAGNVEKTREYVQSLGTDGGKVTIERFDGKRLPLIDNLVNLVVASGGCQVTSEEIARVLAPDGVAVVSANDQTALATRQMPLAPRPLTGLPGWSAFVKPRPRDIDDWTHFLHGPDGNAVAQDDVVGFPNHIQWIGLPEHSRDHEFATSMDVMVSAGGRIFYILDEGSTALPYHLPSRWRLVARDAFNGIVLWKRPLADWRPYQVGGRKSLAADLWRRLVATENRAYVTETIFGPVVALDPKTGKTIRKYEGTERTEEIVCAKGILYLVATTSDPEEIDRRQLAVRRTTPDKKRIMAVEADTGAVLWTKEDGDTESVQPVTLAVKDERLFFQNTTNVMCLEAGTGNEVWRYARPSPYARPGNSTPTLVVYKDVVLSADRAMRRAPVTAANRKGKVQGGELIALSAKDGKEMWRCPCGENYGSPADVFVASGLVWVGEHPGRNASDYHRGRDLRTGEIKKTFSHTENWPTWHHHRCYRDKATEKYILAGRTGIEFVDLDSGELVTHHWVRGICEYGVMPANGLIYSPPDQCACYAESKLHGFHALAPKRESKRRREVRARSRKVEESKSEVGTRLEKGPAYGKLETGNSKLGRNDWPTLRHDNRRSSHTSKEIPLKLKPAWNAEIGGKLTSLVSAEGKVFVAQPDTHLVFCLDAATGESLWSYHAGGRVDSPPSISGRIAVFGCRDGWVYALRTTDGELVWRFRAAPEDLRLVEMDQVASVWPVHGSVLIDDGHVYFAAGRSSCLDGGMYLYKLELATGKTLLEKNYSSRDPKTGEYVNLFTPFDAELLPDRELPGLLPDVFSSDEENLYLRSVPLDHDLAIKDKKYVRHLFGSMGFLEDTWWERSYWIYGSHFYGGARGHGYAKTLYPAGRILAFDGQSVYGYLDPALVTKTAGIFRVPKNPEFVDLAEKLKNQGRRGARSRKGKRDSTGADIDAESIRRTYVWKDGIPRDAQAMQLSRGNRALVDAIRRITKYEYNWHRDAALYPNAMLLTDKTFWLAGPPRFDEDAATQLLSTSPTDRYSLAPVLQDALDTFEGRRGGVLYAVDKEDGTQLAEMRLSSSPVFDGLIAAGSKLFVSLKNGSVVCLEPQ